MPPELAALRASARAAAERRAALEAQISRACAALEGMPCGVSGALVDAEGFPRGDCDVHQARALRHRLACLHTDHKQAEVALERALHADNLRLGRTLVLRLVAGDGLDLHGQGGGGQAGAKQVQRED